MDKNALTWEVGAIQVPRYLATVPTPIFQHCVKGIFFAVEEIIWNHGTNTV